MEKVLAWIAALLALLAMLFLPALRASAPLTTPAEWTIGQLAVELGRASSQASQPSGQRRPALRPLLQRAEDTIREFGGNGNNATRRRLETALALGALIPIAALLAGLCALLGLLFTAWPVRWAHRLAAAAGVAASAYAIGASWWLTRTAQTAADALVANLQHRLGGLLGGLNLDGLGRQTRAAIGLWPEAGLFVLLLAFTAMLVLPPPHRRRSRPSGALPKDASIGSWR